MQCETEARVGFLLRGQIAELSYEALFAGIRDAVELSEGEEAEAYQSLLDRLTSLPQEMEITDAFREQLFSIGVDFHTALAQYGGPDILHLCRA